MKAKQVSESIRNILKPKSREEIIDAVKKLKIASYNLVLFIKLLKGKKSYDHHIFADMLEQICDEMNIDVKDMEVSKLSYTPFIDQIFGEIFDKASDERKLKTRSIKHGSHFKIFEFVEKYKLIRFEPYYYAFPKKFPKEIFEFIDI